MVITLILVSCSSSPGLIKSETTTKNLATDTPLIQSENPSFDFKQMEFPLSDEIEVLDSWVANRIITLKEEIMLYRDVHGEFPDSISTLITSGFLLRWPRNPLTGKPVEVVTGRDLLADRGDFGKFKYEIINDSEFSLSCISLDRDYKTTVSEQWRVETSKYGYRTPDEMDKARGINSVHKKMHVIGTQKTPEEILDFNNRLLCGMVGNLDFIINSSINRHYAVNEVLPESFYDVLDSQDFIIKENFKAFAQMLKDSGAFFKWGFDGNTRYFELIIDGETYIKQCVTYSDLDENSMTNGMTFECLTSKTMFDTLDKSAPIVTSQNIVDVVIPEEYLISIKDIPLS